MNSMETTKDERMVPTVEELTDKIKKRRRALASAIYVVVLGRWWIQTKKWRKEKQSIRYVNLF